MTIINRTGSAFLHVYKTELFLACCWIIVQSVLFYQHGIVTELEATKYIGEADVLLATGKVDPPNFWLYSVQIFLIAAAKKFHTGYVSVAIVQWVFSAIAARALYRFCTLVADRVTGLIVTSLFIFNIPLQTFNFFLQTESLFYSFTILFSCYLLRLQKLTWKNFILVFLFLVVICFTRPTGLLWIPCAFLYLFFRFFKAFSVPIKIGITVVSSVAFLFFLNAALGSGGELDFMLPFRDENIICGVPTLSNRSNIDTTDDPNSVFGLIYYITHNFDQFMRLAWLRSKAFWGLTRSYYSPGHNLYLILYFYPVCLLALLGIRSWFKNNRHLLLYCCSLIIITWGTVMLTCDDWHNRFFLSIVPYIYFLIVPVIKSVTNKIKTAAGK